MSLIDSSISLSILPVEIIWNSDILAWGVVLVGLCIGSFLNVVIYRMPRGLSVNEPKRSFCPVCKATLPVWQNIPILTWLLQMGKCRSCGAPIPVRYLLVEALTGALYFGAWWFLPMWSAMIAMALFTILVVITFIDAEHQLIPSWWTSIGSLIALLCGLIPPDLLDLSGELFSGKKVSGWAGMIASAKGWLAGFGGLALVVILGKMAFGRFKLEFEEPEKWKLQEGHGENSQLHFVIGENAYSWDDLFYRDSDVLIIEGQGFKIDGKGKGGKQMEIRRDKVTIGDSEYHIEPLKSLEGKVTKATVPREAMGMGDPHLLGMIGAFLGWPAVVYVVFSGSLYALLAALVARVGFGRPLPFGPFLALGALSWIFGGWTLWNWYFDGLRERF